MRGINNGFGDENFTYRFLDVGLLVEVREEEVEHDGMAPNPPGKGFGIIAIDEE